MGLIDDGAGIASRSWRTTILPEENWRSPALAGSFRRAKPRIIVSRWVGADLREKSSEIGGDYHVISVCLQPSRFSLQLGAGVLAERTVAPGMMQITAPALPARIIYHTPYDTLHLTIHNDLLRECYEWARDTAAPHQVELRDPNFYQDPLIEQLGCALATAEKVGGAHNQLYADSLSLTIVARIVAFYGAQPVPVAQGRAKALESRRVRLATEFIEANLEGQLSLTELAGAVGLSRMYFASQFRKATGLRPHEYVLRRRIARAKIRLATTDAPISAIALGLGFSSQAHFTLVFKRLVGTTPHAWRNHNRS